MISVDRFKYLAYSLQDVTEEPHFEKTSFKINKKIFATLNIKDKQATIKLNAIDQSVFCANPNYLSPVPNKWGKQGWTIIHLHDIPEEMCWDALQKSYDLVAKRK
ncbi:MAG: MmcQ/YjbR family DNA-binding protein [Flavobacterium sp.]|nr:MmcQ/YjbR family DNA-binding protein [Flavobacterium sp.]